MSKLLLILHTVKYLRSIQIRYQLWYRVRKLWRRATGFKYPLSIEKDGHPLKFTRWIEKPTTFKDGTFTFLNISLKTSSPLGGNQRGSETCGAINWNEPKHGKLWTYNLNYMDYLLQPGMDAETGIQLIKDFINNLNPNSEGLEPYPIALRSINWIKFISKLSLREGVTTTWQSHNLSTVNASLYAQYQILLGNLEYHLMANHLLEDGFSLLFGAYYFNDTTLYNKANKIITAELKEQILDDGAHFERSPMYHQIIFDRLLDCINLVQNNQSFPTQDSLLELMQNKAKRMLAWLNNITFSNGEIPMLNDSAPGIAPTTTQLNNYATSLNLKSGTRNLEFSSSGYRFYNGSNYECIIDIGNITPSYQPGHAHADTFNFVLNVNQKPVLVDTGISTYEANNRRLQERGTVAHNTVSIQDQNSSEIWSSFRVAQRAKVKIISEDDKTVTAEHNGFKKFGLIHKREWNFENKYLTVSDYLKGGEQSGNAHFYFAPGLKPYINNQIVQLEDVQLHFSSFNKMELSKTSIPIGYNQYIESYKIEIIFKNQLKTTINLQ